MYTFSFPSNKSKIRKLVVLTSLKTSHPSVVLYRVTSRFARCQFARFQSLFARTESSKKDVLKIYLSLTEWKRHTETKLVFLSLILWPRSLSPGEPTISPEELTWSELTVWRSDRNSYCIQVRISTTRICVQCLSCSVHLRPLQLSGQGWCTTIIIFVPTPYSISHPNTTIWVPFFFVFSTFSQKAKELELSFVLLGYLVRPP